MEWIFSLMFMIIGHMIYHNVQEPSKDMRDQCTTKTLFL
jgi:hypothetical protein